MTELQWIRQGDIALKRVLGGGRPTTPGKEVTLAKGETTGHAHVLQGAIEFDRAEEPRFIVVHGTAQLVHQEHATVEIPDGVWEVVRQREFWGEERRVTD